MTEEQFEYLKEKYINLFYYAYSYVYYKDKKGNDDADYEQDFYVLLLKVVDKYKQKTEKEIEEFYETVEFGQYLKTSIWNWKVSKGIKNQEATKINDSQSLTIEEEDYIIPDSVTYSSVEYVEAFKDLELEGDVKDMVNKIVSDPTYFHPGSGEVNMSKLSREMGKTLPVTHAIFKQMTIDLSIIKE